MANKKKNPLNFTALDYDAIRTQIQNAVDRDPDLETFRDSSIAQTLLDLFAGTTDLTNYYIERRAEEQFLDTARLKSSVIMLSKLLGYVPTRPIPARSGLSIVLKGPLPVGLAAGDTITFNKLTNAAKTTFVGDDLAFGLRYTYKYTFTSADVAGGIGNSNWTKTISRGISLSADDMPIPVDVNGSVDPRLLVDIELVQGELIEDMIYGTISPQVGQIFQKYKISDSSFCNYYGEEDWGYDSTNDTENLDENLTYLGLGISRAEAEANKFSIKRRSIIDPNQLAPDDDTVPKIVLFSSNMDEGINIYFGDGNFAKKGLESSSNNIYMRYFSTKGKIANKAGVIGEEITSPNTFVTDIGSIDITNNISFKFYRNITNGSDFESVDSIKLNSPEIYYSLDRLVSKKDYISYLKSQTIGEHGDTVKNAIAWGEQEEIRRRGQLANFRFFNVMFFTLLGSIYKFPPDGVYGYLDDDQIQNAYLETSADFSSVIESVSGVVSADGYPEQVYFNVLVKELPKPEVQRVADFRALQADHPISLMYDRIEKRAQSTVRPIYISPIVQKFKLKGRVSIGKLEDRVNVRKKVNNNIYEWLNDNADFAVNIQKSNISQLIDVEPEVVNSNIYFEPVRPTRLITTFQNDVDFVEGTTSMSTGTSSDVLTAFSSSIYDYLTSAGFANVKSTQSLATSALLSIYDVPEVSGATLVTSASTLPTSASSVLGIWNSPYTDGTFPDYWYEYKAHARVGYISEFSFYNILMKDIYDKLVVNGAKTSSDQAWGDSQYFKNIMYKMHNDILPIIRTLMLDEEGNIKNYSLDGEISQVQIDLSYQFV